MDAIRTKDKLFLAVVIPVALAIAYLCIWRAGESRRVGEMEREDAALVTVEDYPAELEKCRRLLEEAQAELEAEEKHPMPETKFKGSADDSMAARELAVLEVLGIEGLLVGKSRNAEVDVQTVREVLVRTGLRPDPVCREYSVAGSYPKICSALRTIAERKMSVIPERVEMTEPGRWTLALWL